MQARWCSLLHDTHRCRPAWLHGRSTITVSVFFIALSGRPLFISLPVCVFCFTGAMRVCALVVPRFGFLFCFSLFVVGCTHYSF
ncbi:trans-sialidase [Trypanosoma cruzi Dm28c]|uniref:Trans-sialidase n=1 Tax=Trypanosoma cruzi Dm28c TaxID=1416333 RepID=V5D4U6_TRYCR|nr:trans-sialidase [Trypanosoma cruzi Dm28c]